MVPGIISKIKTKIALLCLGFGDIRGSFLLEIAVAISVIELISGFFITKTIAANKAMRAQVTKNNIETVVISFASFLANNNRLPKPALDESGLENSSTSGISDFVGRVPFNTLGISSKIALDGNGQPLIYIVEPSLTSVMSSIYEKDISDSYFCKGISASSILIKGLRNLSPDLIAFVVDSKDNYPVISDKITVNVSKSTTWISRDMLLMKYLKNCPCKIEKQKNNEIPIGDTFDF